MKLADYRRMKDRELVGMKVKSVEPIGNRLGELPAGIEWTILRKFGGLDLIAEPCDRCGVQLKVTSVKPLHVGDPYRAD